jgi:phosphoglycolate phosphatase
MGRRCLIVSNKKDYMVKELVKKFFGDLVEYAQGEDEENGIGKKPDPQMVLTAIEKCNLKKEECVFIGDSEVDLLTAKNAGLPCISVSWGFRDVETLKQNGATVILNEVRELLNC